MGNGQKAAMRRAKNEKDAKGGGKSQLKSNEAAKTIMCKVCRQTFMMTCKEKELALHVENKHSGKAYADCFST